jgi:(p)ppGpp synthase/HD superfamily hydrolase
MVKMTGAPSFIADSMLLSGAYELARSAHHGPTRRGDTDIDHPVAVAELLHEHGFEEEVVAAALLHDVVEDTTLDVDDVTMRFGSEVGRLVAEMTENSDIESYPQRKAEHRGRITCDPRAAAIYAADKLANTRSLRGRPEQVPAEKLEHYAATLRTLCETHSELPFLPELGEELEALRAERNR